MKRTIDLNEISDGQLYTSDSMVRMGCNDCEGCHLCCTGMGNSIILDPRDVYELCVNLGVTTQQLLEKKYIELNIVDGVILPNIKMNDTTDACSFLNEKGRCSIHRFRPGNCRLFPLGRIYENHDFKYFHQIHECPKPNKTKVKIRKWMDIPDMKSYDAFVVAWHYLLNIVEDALTKLEPEDAKTLNMTVLTYFYMTPFDSKQDFYAQFDSRKEKIYALINQVLS